MQRIALFDVGLKLRQSTVFRTYYNGGGFVFGDAEYIFERVCKIICSGAAGALQTNLVEE